MQRNPNRPYYDNVGRAAELEARLKRQGRIRELRHRLRHVTGEDRQDTQTELDQLLELENEANERRPRIRNLPEA